MNWIIFRKALSKFVFLAIVCFPCLVEASTFPLGYVGSEGQHGLFVFNDVTFQYRLYSDSTWFGDVKGLAFIKKPLYLQECSAESSRRFVERLTTAQPDAVNIRYDTSEYGPSKCADCGTVKKLLYCIKDKFYALGKPIHGYPVWMELLALILVIMVSSVTGALTTILVFHFSQRAK